VSGKSPAPVPIWRRGWVWLVVCLAVGFTARVGAVVAFHSIRQLQIGGRMVHSPAEQSLFPDSWEYLRMAENLLAGEGLTTVEIYGRLSDDPEPAAPGSEEEPQGVEKGRIARMPGYPIFLAGVQLVFGPSKLAVRLAQAVLGTVTVALAYVLAQRLFGRAEAVVAGLFVAVYPFFILYSVLILSEVLFIVFMLAALVCLVLAYQRPGRKWSLLAGLGLGLATLVRASFLPFGVLAAVAWVVLRRFERRALLGAALMLAAFAATMTPWVVRNWYASRGHLVLTTLRAGASLYEGLNPDADGGPMMDRIDWDQGTARLDDYERDKRWRHLALDFARNHPGRVLSLAGAKLVRFWNVVPNLQQFQKPIFCVALGGPYVVVMLLALWGVALSWRRAETALILLLPVVYYSLVHTVFVGSVRYRLAVMPMVVVLAAHGLVGLWSRWRRAPAEAAG